MEPIRPNIRLFIGKDTKEAVSLLRCQKANDRRLVNHEICFSIVILHDEKIHLLCNLTRGDRYEQGFLEGSFPLDEKITGVKTSSDGQTVYIVYYINKTLRELLEYMRERGDVITVKN